MTDAEIEYLSPDSDLMGLINSSVDIIKQVFSDGGIMLGLNDESVKWLDGYINRNRELMNDEQRHNMIGRLGAFFGQCVIKVYGGRWGLYNGMLGVNVKGDTWVFPFNKMEKQFTDGETESSYSLFQSIALVLGGFFDRATVIEV